MASWNSVPLEVSYEVLGWFAFICWSVSFYPQVILNFRRKRYPVIFLIISIIPPKISIKFSSSFLYSSQILFPRFGIDYWLIGFEIQCGGAEFRFRAIEFDKAHLLSDIQRISILQSCYSEAVLWEIWLWRGLLYYLITSVSLQIRAGKFILFWQYSYW